MKLRMFDESSHLRSKFVHEFHAEPEETLFVSETFCVL
jgi:hypothetical protein